ncbi:MAG: acetate kinase [Christensenellaceae bacterium]|jgi:acetate kinase|nr:acetate kinase [Christensenellaceae bacterium]
MKVLVLNAGSSSLKYQVIDTDTEAVLGKGIVERIGIAGSNLEQKVNGSKYIINREVKDHTEAFQLVIEAITDTKGGFLKSVSEIDAAGHRVLHGAEDFKDSILITPESFAICKTNEVMGPLHQPANLACIKSVQALLPNIPNVAVFDTAFHATMPAKAYMYAIPYEDYKNHRVRRYGFHGTSHKYVTGEALRLLKNKPGSRVITCHLGNGSSMAAVKDGKVIDTSMGLTPLEGLIMGTRSGDIDPAVVAFLSNKEDKQQYNIKSFVDVYLNKKSGFLGLTGSSDFREVTGKAKSGDEIAMLAVDMFAYRVQKYIGEYYVALGGLDMLVFTGGIGENADFAREKIAAGLSCLGIEINDSQNKATHGEFADISGANSKVKVMVIPTNEELVIARDTVRVLSNK